MIHLTDGQVSKLLQNREHEILTSMSRVFSDYKYGRAQMVPKIYLDNHNGDFRAMPASWDNVAGVKWISVYPGNRQYDRPTIQGTFILNNIDTGEPLISMDCGVLTAYRTAAVSALAAKKLSKTGIGEDIVFIGCGYQAKIHLMMYESALGSIGSVELYDTNKKAMKEFHDWIGEENIARSWGWNKSVSDACKNPKIITTLTPATEPYLNCSHICSNTHINAVGADAPGKREITDSIWMKCSLIVDDYTQALHSGETQHSEDSPYIDLADIIAGTCKLPEGPTLFDSTGLAIEDVAIGKLIYKLYNEEQLEIIHS
jgi:alanine dehydrogenase